MQRLLRRIALLIAMAGTSAMAQDTYPDISRYTKNEQAALTAGFKAFSDTPMFLWAPFGAYKVGTMWESSKVKVCWTIPGMPSDSLRKVVQVAIAESWSKQIPLQFVGWGNCTDTTDPDIRIMVASSMSVTYAVGKNLRKWDPSMLLVTDYSGIDVCKVKDAAKPNSCLKANAIHEFGHALGLTHENLRDDAPKWCKEFQLKEDTSGPSPDGTVGKADVHSIMNFCNLDSLNDGKLSDGDKDTIKKLYAGLM